MLAERGSVEVRCDFCNRAYQFDPVDIEQIFSCRHMRRLAAAQSIDESIKSIQYTILFSAMRLVLLRLRKAA